MLCFFSCVTVIVKKDELGSIGPKQIVIQDEKVLVMLIIKIFLARAIRSRL